MAAKKKVVRRKNRRQKPIQFKGTESGRISSHEANLCEAGMPKKLGKRERELEEAYSRGRTETWRELTRAHQNEQEALRAKHDEELHAAKVNILTQLSYMMQHNANFMEGAFRVIDRIVPKGQS